MKKLTTPLSIPIWPPRFSLASTHSRRNQLRTESLWCCLCLLTLLTGCTEKAGLAISVVRDKAEARLLALAGEGEVAIELHRRQYAALKERLVQLKTILAQHQDSLEQAYASDDARRIQIYTTLVAQLGEKIPAAESALREGYSAFEAQRQEIRRIKEEIGGVRSTAMQSETLDLESDFQKRAALIRDLTESLRTKLRRAQALLEVNKTEENFQRS
jgi:hypothetical protein